MFPLSAKIKPVEPLALRVCSASVVIRERVALCDKSVLLGFISGLEDVPHWLAVESLASFKVWSHGLVIEDRDGKEFVLGELSGCGSLVSLDLWSPVGCFEWILGKQVSIQLFFRDLGCG